jgi:hypothetical protein
VSHEAQSRETRERPEKQGGTRFGGIAPLAVLGALVLVPLVIWAASSGGDGGAGLIVEAERAGSYGPELIVSVDRKLNTDRTTGGKATVGLVCRDSAGREIVNAQLDWPFIEEPGFDYPHAHYPLSLDSFDSVVRCRLRGTSSTLEGEVRR